MEIDLGIRFLNDRYHQSSVSFYAEMHLSLYNWYNIIGT
jgi:hypothetical protein